MAPPNAFRSSGLRLVIKMLEPLWQMTTSSSTHSPPALRMSVCRLGHDVKRRPGEYVGLDQCPRPMTYRSDGLSRSDELTDEADGGLVHTQLIGVRNTARQDNAVKVLDLELIGRHIDVEGVCLFKVVNRLSLT